MINRPVYRKRKIKQVIADMFDCPQDYRIFECILDENDEDTIGYAIKEQLLYELETEDFIDLLCLDGRETPKRKAIVINYVKNYKV